ncbi:MAG: penicillin acylase family protein [Pseudomonadota bacterium]
MGSFWRLARLTAIAALVMSLGLAAALYILASRSLPRYSGEASAQGLEAPIEILRDRRAVPHIFADSEADAYFGLGYAHAQDRLWQMTLHRAATRGLLTELAGGWGRASGLSERLLQLDVAARTVDLHGRAARSLRAMDPQTLRVLDAYAAGVNAWLGQVDVASLGRGAPELLFLGANVASWTPADSVALFKLQAALNAWDVFDELTRARFLTALGPQRVADLFPARGDGGPRAFSPSAFGQGRPDPLALFSAAPEPFGRIGQRGGAHLWAAAGSRSATRAPLMATDRQSMLTAPGPWYAARLTYPRPQGPQPATLSDRNVSGAPAADRLEVIGTTLPGVPAILQGRSGEISWAVAAFGADAGDIFIERVDPDDPSRYLTPQGWAPFGLREATIPVGGGRAVAATLRETRHGPVLPLDWPEVAAATPKGHVAALSWTPLSEDDVSLEAALRLSRARDALEALAAAERHVTPPQLVLVADRRSIALSAVGRAPLRRLDSLSRGAKPGNGWSAQNSWTGWLDPAELPRVIDPPSGLITAADAAPPLAAFPRHLGQDWAAPYRHDRIEKLLNSREFHSQTSFRAIQTDTVSEAARAVLPLIAERLWAERDRESGARREALDRLAAWNGDMDAFLAEPLIYATWARALTRRLTADDLGMLSSAYATAAPAFLERVFLNRGGAAARWCDDVRTQAAERCADMASLALDDALAELAARYGEAIDGWRWGRAHSATHRHHAFGDTPLLASLLNIRQETGGGDHTVLRGLSSGALGGAAAGDAPFAVEAAAGFRAIYDFADLDRSSFALSTGQSGHFLSRHYDDFAEVWRAGDYASLSLARRDAEAGSVGALRLIPFPIEPSPDPGGAEAETVAGGQ